MQRPHYRISESGTWNRRDFILATSSLAAASLWADRAVGAVKRNPSFVAYPFSLGVASGDPSADGMALWTRLAPDPLNGGGMIADTIEVSWIIAEDEGMQRIAQKGTTVARPDWGHSVHVEAEGLEPDRWYWYQFKAGAEVSPIGRTRTMPAKGSRADKLRFAFASCQHFESGYYTAFEHMAGEGFDLIAHLGDYIYEYKGKEDRIRIHNGDEIVSVADYRNRYAQYKSDPDLQAAHAAAPWLVTWDDHEVDNNYASDISEEVGIDREGFRIRRANAYKAYYEHMPLRRRSLPQGPDMQLYRNVSFGDLAEFYVLDTRQYRTDQPCGDAKSVLCEDAFNPANTMLGETQRDWLFKGLGQSKSKWNVLAQQVMVARHDRDPSDSIGFSMDKWTSCEVERRLLLDAMGAIGVDNPVVLTGDIHTNWANELWLDERDERSPSVGVEFVGTSISSGGDGAPFPKNLEATLRDNPFVKFHNGERGYVSCEVSSQEWTTRYRTVDYVTRKGAPIRTRAAFTVEDGQSRLNAV